MPDVFDAFAWPAILALEGEEFVNDPDDQGGPTKYGVTERVARAYGWKGRMQDLPIEFAKSVAKLRYWDPMSLDEIAEISQSIAMEMFEAGYHLGVYWPSIWLQQWLNALNYYEKWYADIAEDSRVGPITLQALRSYIEKRGDEGAQVLLAGLNADQAVRYKQLGKEKYTYGWMAKRVAKHP